MVLEVAFSSLAYLKLVLATNFLVAYLQEVANVILSSWIEFIFLVIFLFVIILKHLKFEGFKVANELPSLRRIFVKGIIL